MVHGVYEGSGTKPEFHWFSSLRIYVHSFLLSFDPSDQLVAVRCPFLRVALAAEAPLPWGGLWTVPYRPEVPFRKVDLEDVDRWWCWEVLQPYGSP